MAILTKRDGTSVNLGESTGEFKTRMQLNRIAQRGLSESEKKAYGSSSTIIEEKAKRFSELPLSDQKSSVTELGFGGYYTNEFGRIEAQKPKNNVTITGQKRSDKQGFSLVVRDELIRDYYDRLNKKDTGKEITPELVKNVFSQIERKSRGTYVAPYKLPFKDVVTKDKDIALTENVMSQVKRYSLEKKYQPFSDLKDKTQYLVNIGSKLKKGYISREEKTSRFLKLDKLQSSFERKVSARREGAIKKLEDLGQISKAEELKAQRGQLTAGLEVTKDITSRPLKNIGEIVLTTGTLKALKFVKPSVAKGLEIGGLSVYGASTGIQGFTEYKTTGKIDKTIAFGLKDLAVLGVSSKLSKITNKDIIRGYKAFDKKLLEVVRPKRLKGVIELKRDQFTLKDITNLKRLGKKGYIAGSGSEEEIKALKIAKKKADIRIEQEKFKKLEELSKQLRLELEKAKPKVKTNINKPKISLDKNNFKGSIADSRFSKLDLGRGKIQKLDLGKARFNKIDLGSGNRFIVKAKPKIKRINKDLVKKILGENKAGSEVYINNEKYKIIEINKEVDVKSGNVVLKKFMKQKVLQKVKSKTKVKTKQGQKQGLMRDQKQGLMRGQKQGLMQGQIQIFKKGQKQKTRKVLITKLKFNTETKSIIKAKPTIILIPRIKPKLIPKLIPKQIPKIIPKQIPKIIPRIKPIQKTRKVLIPNKIFIPKIIPNQIPKQKPKKVLIPKLSKKEKKPIILFKIPKFSNFISKRKKKGRITKPKYFYTTTLITSGKASKKMKIGSFTGLEVRN